MNSNTELIIYTTDDGVTKVEATFDGDTVWLSQEQMGELFQRDKSTISRHIRNIFIEGELDEKVVVAEIATTSPHGAMKGKTQNNITYNRIANKHQHIDKRRQHKDKSNIVIPEKLSDFEQNYRLLLFSP